MLASFNKEVQLVDAFNLMLAEISHIDVKMGSYILRRKITFTSKDLQDKKVLLLPPFSMDTMVLKIKVLLHPTSGWRQNFSKLEQGPSSEGGGDYRLVRDEEQL